MIRKLMVLGLISTLAFSYGCDAEVSIGADDPFGCIDDLDCDGGFCNPDDDFCYADDTFTVEYTYGDFCGANPDDPDCADFLAIDDGDGGDGGECVDDTDCGDGEVCDGDVCVPDDSGDGGDGGDCADDTDCADGEVCDAGTCSAA